ncbi:tRNA (adenosine(37)-N6)-threonylcarbamoyltransferase complex dimerization subunit type 1 TsaB [Magnetovibrio sp. PR-2]|uniref:tRNA (adenosine(37)-N6)-threonylcarbamoyltransferase complex dimerization subunit type 1 TsaB n=1 Tax=Magnetovibrio sp. PR-2 TaxID=3120356 RepID=UPI002FCDFAE5
MSDTPVLILALDCTTTGCSAAVMDGNCTLALDAREMARGQAEVLLPMIEGVLKEADRLPKDLCAVAITRGPGAFTGMRIGLSTARAYALALGIPCIGVTTLEAVAANVGADERQGHVILAAIESKRADIYVQLFDEDLKALNEPTAAEGQAIAAMIDGQGPVICVGDASGRAQEMAAPHGGDLKLSSAPALPDARLVGQIALSRFDGAKSFDPPAPLYLRPPDAKLPKNQGRARP